MISKFRTGVTISHLLLKEFVGPGDVAIDATCGNGNDTLYLAQLVGPKGKVYALDVQELAINNTRIKLEEHQLLQAVELIQTSHENIARIINGKVKAVIFNLGYLPGGDHSLITKPETTIQAIENSMSLITVGGAIIIVIYSGHEGGTGEGEQVYRLAKELPKKYWNTVYIAHINREATSPHIIMLEKIQETEW